MSGSTVGYHLHPGEMVLGYQLRVSGFKIDGEAKDVSKKGEREREIEFPAGEADRGPPKISGDVSIVLHEYTASYDLRVYAPPATTVSGLRSKVMSASYCMSIQLYVLNPFCMSN